MTIYTYLESPIGRLLLQSDGAALTGLYMNVVGRSPRGMEAWTEDATRGPLPEAARQLGEYFAGKRRDFDLPLHMEGTEFQQRVWQSLTQIPYGVTWSYGQLAKRINNPNASRAVGLANGRNPISIIVPCHRVIGADGSLTGFGGGLERKQWLLAHEGVHRIQADRTGRQQTLSFGVPKAKVRVAADFDAPFPADRSASFEG